MSATEPVIRNISDTARWAALYRARETERPDALFRDPLARRLAGERGEQIAALMPFSNQHDWTWTSRTYLFDRFITEQIAQGVDTVINLAAGLDARPYRLSFPAALRWVEVDLPEILTYKEEVLRDETPHCQLERVHLDLADVPARRGLFERLGRDSKKALIITEGLIIYLSPEEVGSLAAELSATPSFAYWVLDLGSPGLIKMLQEKMGGPLAAAGSPLKFGPAEGPLFFEPFGWKPADVQSMVKTAGRLGRLPWWLKLISLLPESKGRQGSRPWSAVCLMANTNAPISSDT